MKKNTLILLGCLTSCFSVLQGSQLIRAAVYSKLETIQVLITSSTTINFQDEAGCSALMMAVIMHRPANILQAFIDAHADVNLQDNHDMTALMYAACNGNDSNIQALIATPSIDLNLQDRNGDTALMLAIQNLNMPAALILIAAGADIYLQNNAGDCPARLLMKEDKSKTKTIARGVF